MSIPNRIDLQLNCPTLIIIVAVAVISIMVYLQRQQTDIPDTTLKYLKVYTDCTRHFYITSHISCIYVRRCKLQCPVVITHADGSRMSIAIIRVCDSVILCVCVSVCLSVRTIKPKRLKLKSPNLAQK